MTRGEIAETVASVARMAADLVEEAEDETVAVSRDLATANATNDALRREIADYERTVAALREQLRAEEARRASFQAVDAAARRFIRRFRLENPEAGWKAGWRCPIVEMQALLDVVPMTSNNERA